MENYFLHEPSNKIFTSRVSMMEKSKCLRLSRRIHSRPFLLNEITKKRKAVLDRDEVNIKHDDVEDIKEWCSGITSSTLPQLP